MFSTRKLKEYKDFKAIEPEPIYIHKTFTPVMDEKERVIFDVRSVGPMTHMSSTMFLERRLKGRIVMPSQTPERYTIDGFEDRLFHGVASSDDCRFMRKPGFILQENIEQMNMSFNGGLSRENKLASTLL